VHDQASRVAAPRCRPLAQLSPCPFTSGGPRTRPDVSLAGHELTLSPHLLSSAALLFAPPSGPSGPWLRPMWGHRTWTWPTRLPTPAYLIVDANHRLPGRTVLTRLSAANLFNRRPPVTQSELATPPITCPGRDWKARWRSTFRESLLRPSQARQLRYGQIAGLCSCRLLEPC